MLYQIRGAVHQGGYGAKDHPPQYWTVSGGDTHVMVGYYRMGGMAFNSSDWFLQITRRVTETEPITVYIEWDSRPVRGGWHSWYFDRGLARWVPDPNRPGWEFIPGNFPAENVGLWIYEEVILCLEPTPGDPDRFELNYTFFGDYTAYFCWYGPDSAEKSYVFTLSGSGLPQSFSRVEYKWAKIEGMRMRLSLIIAPSEVPVTPPPTPSPTPQGTPSPTPGFTPTPTPPGGCPCRLPADDDDFPSEFDIIVTPGGCATLVPGFYRGETWTPIFTIPEIRIPEIKLCVNWVTFNIRLMGINVGDIIRGITGLAAAMIILRLVGRV